MSERAPYPGLAPFGRDDAPYFFGRDRERRLVRAHLFANRLTVLHAPSGVGKSSLLQAGVLPDLLAIDDLPRPLLVVAFDRWADEPGRALRRAIARAAPPGSAAAAADPPGTLVDVVGALRRDHGRDLMLVLDQVEALLLDDGAAARDALAELAALLAADALPVNILLAVREDAFARLDRLGRRLPLLFAGALRLERLDREGAEAAIRRPLDRFNEARPTADRVGIEDELVDAILAAARTAGRQVALGEPTEGAVPPDARAGGGAASPRPDRYEAPILQLLLSRLWEEERGAGGSTLRLATLERLGGAETLVSRYLDRTLDALGPQDQELAALLLHYLVTPSGRSIPYTADELRALAVERGAAKAALVARMAPLLDHLTTSRLLRRLPPLEPGGPPAYQLFHDLLATAAVGWRRRREERGTLEAAALLGAAAAQGKLDPRKAEVVRALERFRGGGRRARGEVLWVDDQPANNRYPRWAMEQLGLTFTLSPSTAAALDELARRRFDAVISDMGRPEGRQAGLDLLARMRERGDQTPLLFYTTSAGTSLRAKAERAGAAGFTDRVDELLDLVASMVLESDARNAAAAAARRFRARRAR